MWFDLGNFCIFNGVGWVLGEFATIGGGVMGWGIEFWFGWIVEYWLGNFCGAVGWVFVGMGLWGMAFVGMGFGGMGFWV